MPAGVRIVREPGRLEESLRRTSRRGPTPLRDVALADLARRVRLAVDGVDEDPEPTDVAVARNGNLYWTCTSAGVIIEAKRRGARH